MRVALLAPARTALTDLSDGPEQPTHEREQVMNPLNRMNPGTPYACSLGTECTRTLTCKGLHTATKPTICTGPETCKDPSHDQPYTGNGYSVAINPLLEEPATIDEHVLLIRARGVSLERWIRKPEDIGTNGPIIREIIARMEGDLQSLRTLVKDIEKAESEPTAFENLCETMPELAERVRSIGKAGE